jgi:hypothetical protein
MKKILALSIFFIFICINSFSQEIMLEPQTTHTPFTFPQQFSQLHNIETSQSFSFSTLYNSSTKSSLYISNFQNRFTYSPLPNLNLELDLNAVQYGSFNSSSGDAKILPNFRLDYFPTDNVHLRIQLQSFPTSEVVRHHDLTETK